MIDRRQFLKNIGISLAGAWMFPNYVFGNSQNEIFKKDSDEILLARMIFGEASGCSINEKVWVGKTPFNRINDGRKYNGEGSLKKVLLHPKQYSCFDIASKNKSNLKKIIYPKGKEWDKSLIIAKALLRSDWETYNFGQTHFYKKNLVGALKRGELKIDPDKLEPIDSTGFIHQFYKEV